MSESIPEQNAHGRHLKDSYCILVWSTVIVLVYSVVGQKTYYTVHHFHCYVKHDNCSQKQSNP